MATHASALKAHRQSLKNREHNRQFRSRLRGALKSIRAAIDGNDLAARQERAEADHLAHRQDGEQGHHSPERRRPLQVAADDPHRRAKSKAAYTPRRRPLSRTQLDDQPFEQHARIAGRSLEVEVGPEQRLDRPGAALAGAIVGNFVRTSQPSCPRIFSGGAPASSISAS